ncbi:MAG: hypothetical protein DSY55_05515 [Clostridia bacterium]|nr:MAG: hypothetical protein DSY55_05515 [Clostridia bacterium]
MTVFLQFLADNARVLYSAVALTSIYFLYRALILRNERRSAIFPLEREMAMTRLYHLFGVAVTLLLILAGVWAASNLLLPEITTGELTGTSTPDVLELISTPTSTPLPPTATPTVTATLKPRPTRRPAPIKQNTPSPPTVAPPPPSSSSCPTQGVIITTPGMGQTLTGPVPITGTANIAAFQFYKLEWSSAGAPNDWHWFAGAETPVTNGVLGTFNPALVPPGAYNLRLVVVDTTGNFPQPCSVRVIVPGS